MNLGKIPGYYFDEEKKKYFKITANHAAQSLGEKYTKSNVRHERQAAKKRKVEERAEKKRRAQTIKRSNLLALPEYAGVGLHREVGARSRARDLIQADDAFVSRLEWEHLFSSRAAVLSAHSMPSSNQTLFTHTAPIMTAAAAGESSFLSTVPSLLTHSLRDKRPDEGLEFTTPDPRFLLTAFSSRIASTSVWPPNDPDRVFACASAGGSPNIYISSLGNQDRLSSPVLFKLGTDETTLWDSAISPTGDTAVISSSDMVHQFSMTGALLDSLFSSENSRSLAWVNPHTVAAGSMKRVVLWDTRSRGSTPRFSGSHTITGVRNVPSSSGTQLLLSTNHGLSLHDTRMSTSNASKPLLNFPLMHEGPQRVFDINKRDLVAVSAKKGAKDEVRILSLRTGRTVRTLRTPDYVSKRPTQLAWNEDERGAEFLQACVGPFVGRWCWTEEEGDA